MGQPPTGEGLSSEDTPDAAKPEPSAAETASPEPSPLDAPTEAVEPSKPEPSSLDTPRETNGPSKPVELDATDEATLEREIEAALGDVSLVQLYGEGPAPAAAPGAAAQGEAASAGTEIKQGKVVGVSDEGVFIDLGGKSQGFLPKEELDEGENPAEMEVGREIGVAVVGYDKRDGLLMLSKKTADQQLLHRSLREGALVEARVTGTNKGGLELTIKGIPAFMPASQIDLVRIENLETLVGQKFICEVTQVEGRDRDIVLSRRNVLEKEREQQREKVWAELEEGQLRHGVVRNIQDYGAFVDIGGVDGLLHVRELSWARVNHPKDILQVGQAIDVVVIGVDREKQRVALSLRQAGGDPWTMVEQKYAVGTRHQAQIKNLANFGAFAELEPGVEGLIPISQMTWAGRIRHPSDVVQPGAMVEVEVLKVEPAKRKIALSMKNLQENPWANVKEKYRVDEVYPGTVARVADFGAFVTLEPGVDGLVHISELADHRVNRAGDVVSAGQQVQVKVLNVEPEHQRIGLSLKAARSGRGGEEFSTTGAPSGGQEQPKGKKKKERPRRGGLTW